MKFKTGLLKGLVLASIVSFVACSQQTNKAAVPAAAQPAQNTATSAKPVADKIDALLVPDKLINDLSPALQRASIITKQLLEAGHFSRHPVTKQMARDWLKDYMNMLDYRHMFFLQSDIDQIIKQYADNLPELTAQGDVSPAFSIFSLYRKRFSDRVAWAQNRLKKPFEFTSNDFYEIDRSTAPWPKNMAEADQLWELRLKFDVLQKRMDRTSKDDPIATVVKHYNSLQKNFLEYDSETVLQLYLTALAELYDPHSQYLGPSALDDFSISTQLSLQGIGAVLSSEDGYCTIKEIVPGGPADLDKRIKPNDRIVAVGQGEEPYVDIIDMKLRNAVKLIRGPKGSKVRLKIMSGADSSKVDEIILTRDKIEFTAQQANAQIFEIPGATPQQPSTRIGVIRLPSFYGDIGETQSGVTPRSTTDDVALLINHLKSLGINGLILDLRSNGGGLLDEAISLTGLFIDKGPVVQVKDSNEKVMVRSNSILSTKIYDGPMAVLTDRLSASASEILAGALQNYGRALIIGNKSTHGKGTVQAVAPLGKYFQLIDSSSVNAGALKLTIQKFYLPNGHSTQNRGVIPDISLPSPNDYFKIGEADMPRALPWDEIPPASGFKPIEVYPANALDLMRTRSQKRIASNPLFAFLQEQIAKVQKSVKEGKISLNEAKRIQERDEEDARLKKAKELEQAFAKSAPAPKRFILKQGNQKAPRVEEAPADFDKKSKKLSQKSKDKDDKSLPKDPTSPDDDDTLSVDLHLHESIAIMLDWMQIKQGKSNSLAPIATGTENLVPEFATSSGEPKTTSTP